MNEYFVVNSYYYFKMLYDINQELVKLIGIDIIKHLNESKALVINIVSTIPKLIPLNMNKASEKYELSNNDGILSFTEDIFFIKEELNNILTTDYDIISKIMRIRNKYEHQVHLLRIDSVSNGSNSPYTIGISIKDDPITINSDEMIQLISMLNNLFSKIAFEISKLALNNKRADTFYNNYLSGFDFTDFNKLYSSDLIETISKLQQDF